MTTRTDNGGPISFTLTGEEYHVLTRELIYVVSTVEAVQVDLKRAADPRSDAWVLATTARLEHVVGAADKVIELMAAAKHRG